MYKPILKIVGVVAAAAVFCIGCGSPSPSAVAESFFAAMSKGDWETVGKYSTPETIEQLTPFASKAQSMAAANGKGKAVKETIEGDKATVDMEFENKKGEEENVDLIKIDGKWKVHMQSSSLGK